ncbi:hypothetical protein [uncultured Kriegella sp.]|uniref:hypothetical protein n=1 Tax=uncultured Kriegella sp. TaxID=1798910 RepID=UPI0030DBBB1E
MKNLAYDFKTIAVVLGLSLLFTIPVKAQKSDFKYYFKKAEKGKSDQFFGLAQHYYYGDGVSQDFKKALHWFEKALEAGKGRTGWAEYFIGRIYKENKELKDYEKAVFWLEKSYAQTEANKSVASKVISDLVPLLFYGKGTAQDLDRAFQLASSLEEKEKPLIPLLAEMYEKGLGTERNDTLAAKYYEIALKNSKDYSGELHFKVAQLREKTTGLSSATWHYLESAQRRYAPAYDEIARIPVRFYKGEELKTLAFQVVDAAPYLKDKPRLQYVYAAMIHSKGFTNYQNYAMAYGYLKNSEAAGIKEALPYLGMHHFYGLSTPKNESLGAEYLLKSSTDMVSQYTLGMMYHKGIYFEKDDAKAFNYLLESSKQGYPPAGFPVAHMLENGIGTKKDVVRASRLHNALILRDANTNSMLRLSEMHRSGVLGRRNIARADELLADYKRYSDVCNWCEGSLIVSCTVCEGTGHGWKYSRNSPRTANRSVLCGQCDGSKVETCPFCFGTGRKQKPNNSSTHSYDLFMRYLFGQ